ncbi:hypothetical protein [Streptomyces sp. NPDC060027]|uniref:hypothetical protein n=1 Tax=Streptomyces sp. NPDC060027 TaxID=3347040 RepID=UPI0036A1A06B
MPGHTEDCLRGRRGAEPPFSPVWHSADIARAFLGVPRRTDHRPPTFEELVAFLAENGVDVRPA